LGLQDFETKFEAIRIHSKHLVQHEKQPNFPQLKPFTSDFSGCKRGLSFHLISGLAKSPCFLVESPFSYAFPMLFLWFSYGFPYSSSLCHQESELLKTRRLFPKVCRQGRNVGPTGGESRTDVLMGCLKCSIKNAYMIYMV